MKKPFILFIIYLFFSLPGTFAQKIKTVEGTAQVRMEANMTENDTRKIAEELAKINALQMAFGSTADQEFNMMIRDGKADYNVIAKTEVKGEWIETTSRHFDYNDSRVDKGKEGTRSVMWITCTIKGKARRLTPRAQFDFYPMNCKDMSCRTTEFTDSANLFLYFKSPVDGYLSVFLDDGTRSYRLLPDNYSPKEFESGVLVKGDQDYLLFSPDHNSLPQKQVKEYYMFTTKKQEYNYLYVIFSENQFVKPILEGKKVSEKRILPKSLSSKKFQEWLSENKYADESFQVKQMAIMIKAR